MICKMDLSLEFKFSVSLELWKAKLLYILAIRYGCNRRDPFPELQPFFFQSPLLLGLRLGSTWKSS